MVALNRELREWEKPYNTVPHINRSATSLLHNTCSSGTLIERAECVTNLLDEFNELTNVKLFASILVILEVKLWTFGFCCGV
jgi:hypothetical protein